MDTTTNPKVAVLMSTYNGEKYLQEQIESVLDQTEVSVMLFVRDDGSKDNTTEILNEYKNKSFLYWYSGPNIGPARSFLDCLSKSPDVDYYAFCDQDDIWMYDKLSSAIDKIKSINAPALYCSDTLLVDQDLKTLRKGNLHMEGTFLESLVSNPVTGCTMVINKALKDIVMQYNPSVIDMHDWWIYRICMAINGNLYFDRTPHIKYRQHNNNVIGGTSSTYSKAKRRLTKLFSSSEGIRFQMTRELFKGYNSIITQDNKEIIDLILSYKTNLRKTLNLAFDKKIRLKSNDITNKFKLAVLLRKF